MEKQSILVSPQTLIALKINVPSLNIQKILRTTATSNVFQFKKSFIEKIGVKEGFNFGFIYENEYGHQFLDEQNSFLDLGIVKDTSLEFVMKGRLEKSNNLVQIQLPNKKKQLKLQDEFLKCIGKSASIDKLLKELKSTDPNFLTEDDETLLSIAVVNEDLDLIQILIENGALKDFRMGPKKNYQSVMHVAAFQGKIKSLRKLIELKCWIDICDASGLTPIYHAAVGGHVEAGLRLLLSQANPNVYDESGKTPLHVACGQDRDAFVALLIDFGANIDSVNIAGNTPLHVAAGKNSKGCVQWLLKRGADRSKTNKAGQTPKIIAATSQFKEIEELIDTFNEEDIGKIWDSISLLLMMKTELPPPKPNIPALEFNLVISNVLNSISNTQPFKCKSLPMSISTRTLVEKNLLRRSHLSLNSDKTDVKNDSNTNLTQTLSPSKEFLKNESVVKESPMEIITKNDKGHEAEVALEKMREVFHLFFDRSTDLESMVKTFNVLEQAVQELLHKDS